MKIRESEKQNGPPTSLASHADQSSPLSSDPRSLSVARVLGEAQGAGLVSLPEGPAGLSKTLFLPPPGAWSPRGWWGEFGNVPRAIWPRSLFPAKGQLGPSSPHSAWPPKRRRLFGVRNHPPAFHRSPGCGRHGACAPSPQGLPSPASSGLCFWALPLAPQLPATLSPFAPAGAVSGPGVGSR